MKSNIDSLYTWLRSIFNEFEIVSRCNKKSIKTEVWKIKSSNNNYFVKILNNELMWYSEVYTYNKLENTIGTYIPNLVSTYNENGVYAIITKELKGLPLRKLSPTRDKLLICYYKAGMLTKHIHSDIVCDNFGVLQSSNKDEIFNSNIEYAKYNFYKFCGKAIEYDCLLPHEYELFLWNEKNFDLFVNEKPFLINHDYTPSNWIVDVDGNFIGIIDFEGMNYGFKVDSFARLHERYLYGQQDLKESFYQGYGSNPMKENPLQARFSMIKRGITSVCCGVEQNNYKVVNFGRRILSDIYNSVDVF